MTMYDTLRLFLKNILIPLATISLGSVWFALSILSHFVGLILPPTQQTPAPLSKPRRSNGTSVVRSAAKPVAPLPSILSPWKESAHHVRFPNAVPQPTARPRVVQRWSSPAGLQAGAPLFMSRDRSLVEDIGCTTPDNSVFCINKLLPHLARLDAEHSPSVSSSLLDEEPMPLLSRNASMPMPRKASLTSKLPTMNVFRSRSKGVKSEGRHSRSGSLSSSVASTPPLSPQIVPLDLKVDPEKGSTSTFSSNELPPTRSGFGRTFKFRSKRVSASATMSASADRSSTAVREDLRAFQQPSPPPSPDRETELPPSVLRSRSQSRRKAFVSYLNLASPNHQRSATGDESSPRTATLESSLASAQSRSLFSPATPRSLCSKTKTKVPSGPVPRTQPYGYPYFAMMPNGEYAEPSPDVQSARRRSFGGSLPRSERGTNQEPEDKEGADDQETPFTATPANTLGLDLGSGTARAPRHRHRASLS